MLPNDYACATLTTQFLLKYMYNDLVPRCTCYVIIIIIFSLKMSYYYYYVEIKADDIQMYVCMHK